MLRVGRMWLSATLHTHEGENENWYATYAPKFVEEFARKTIDAGATCFVGRAPTSRVVWKCIRDAPFSTIGQLADGVQWGESMISPEMYETYHLGPDAHPSQSAVFESRSEV